VIPLIPSVGRVSLRGAEPEPGPELEGVGSPAMLVGLVGKNRGLYPGLICEVYAGFSAETGLCSLSIGGAPVTHRRVEGVVAFCPTSLCLWMIEGLFSPWLEFGITELFLGISEVWTFLGVTF